MKTLLALLLSIVTYSSPVNYDITLAGNFGEPRPNHFHGGIDIKTGRVQGKIIHSIGDGYVSRITIGLYGYGNALYVQHPEGYTSVYCHLKTFTPQIKAIVRKWQYKNHSSVADIHLKAYECPVASEQMIALSGNSGASEAPHLHLEIHETKSWNMIDPLELLGSHVKDDTPPLAHAFMAYPQKGEGIFNNDTGNHSYAFTSHSLTQQFTAWGKVGFGIWANDYMPESSGNKYGIRNTRLLVDGREIFHSNINNIPTKYNRMVNSWGDYDHYMKRKIWYMKSFKEPGNLLPFIDTDTKRGIVDFNQERDYHIQYILTDFFGNSSEYSFIVTGKRTPIPHVEERKNQTILHHNRAYIYKAEGVVLTIPKGSLAQNTEIHKKRRRQPESFSDLYSFSNTSIPLFDWAQISLKLNKEVDSPDKLYIVCHSKYDIFAEGRYSDGWVIGKIRDLGCSYEILYDNTPPEITPVSENQWKDREIITINVEDGRSGVAGCKGFIDGQFVLFSPVEKSTRYVCNLRETPIQPKNKLRTLRFTAFDNRNNQSTITRQIKY